MRDDIIIAIFIGAVAGVLIGIVYYLYQRVNQQRQQIEALRNDVMCLGHDLDDLEQDFNAALGVDETSDHESYWRRFDGENN